LVLDEALEPKGLRGELKTGMCPLCWDEESVIHILLHCQETQWTEKHVGKKWLQMNVAVAFKKLLICPKTTDQRQLGLFLYKIRCKWDHHTKQSRAEEKAV
jgi:hypothetical protein